MSKKKTKSLGLLGLLPFLLFLAAATVASFYIFDNFVEQTAYFGLVVGDRPVQAEEPTPDDGFVAGEATSKLPSIAYGTQFARLNVAWEDGGWSISNVPIYLGNDEKLLKKGAGLSFGGGFFGQGQRIIVSAHVTREFAELEDTPFGAIISIETTYGPYSYRVIDKVSFEGTERYWISPTEDSGEQLVLYTCYPRNNDGRRRTQRCALICEKLTGLEVTR